MDFVAICNNLNKEIVVLVIVLLIAFVLFFIYIEHRDNIIHKAVSLVATNQNPKSITSHRDSELTFNPTAPPPPYHLL